MNQGVTLTRQALKTPRAAAVAGIIFAVLFTISIVLMRLAIPEELSGTNTAAWLQGNTTTLTLALTLVPFAGIAFLWFIGVVRDRLGRLGRPIIFDRLLWQRVIVSSYDICLRCDRRRYSFWLCPRTRHVNEERRPCLWACSYVHDHESGRRSHECVFMIALATIWMRTGVMPRLFVFLSYALALVLLVSSDLTAWLILVFPAWVFVISVYILVESLRGQIAEGVISSTSHHEWDRTIYEVRTGLPRLSRFCWAWEY